MTTPICDFLDGYNEKGALRFHMPGHKGRLSAENALDITEIEGADSLYDPNGIIKESEKNASALFGSNCFYSTEGSSLCIRAMLYLYRLYAGSGARIIAARNAHKSFISSAALLGIDIEWIYPAGESYLSGKIDLCELEQRLARSEYGTAVYITSPDYLGGIADIKDISVICAKHKGILMVDNAHGAYLKFLPESRHPIDLGADMCCDSAHKTLPVLTGGAYLHIARKNAFFSERAKDALSLFGSTSPSYLILRSLDRANAYLSDAYGKKLEKAIIKTEKAKKIIEKSGFEIFGDEPLKITVLPRKKGYYGDELALLLRKSGIYPEFSDRDSVVFMVTPENGEDDLERLAEFLFLLPDKTPKEWISPAVCRPERAVSPTEALFADTEIIETQKCEGRIFAGFNVACPPAVQIIACGEKIDAQALKCLEYYGVKACRVVKHTDII